MRHNYDYSRTMMLKILLAVPDGKGGSNIKCTLDNALDIIRQTDNITMGCHKIIYLVGWQYNGHDDKYPAFFAVNEQLRRQGDRTAEESLKWLIREARNYNTDVSLHINLTDAYPDSPLWEGYARRDLILKSRSGKHKVTGVWGGKEAYQVVAHREISSGMFYKRVDKLLSIFPSGMLRTIHVDAFFVRRGKGVTIAAEKAARRKMIEYFNIKGLDVTSEFIYREHNCGLRLHHGDSDVIGLIPAFWNPVYSRRDIIKHPARLLAGGCHCKALTVDKSIGKLIYGNIHGEEIYKSDKWQGEFIKEFATCNLPYFFLNGYKRQRVVGIGHLRKLIHSGEVVSSVIGAKIKQGGELLKCGNEVFLPLHWLNDSYALYTENGGIITRTICASTIDIYRVESDGLHAVSEYTYHNNILRLDATAHCLYKIVGHI